MNRTESRITTGLTVLMGLTVLGDVSTPYQVTDHTRECLQQVTGNPEFRGTLTPKARVEVEACMVEAGHGQRYTRARLAYVFGEVDGQE